MHFFIQSCPTLKKKIEMSLSEMVHYQKNANKLSTITTITDWGQNIHVPFSLLQREKITRRWYIGEINDLPFHIKSQRMKKIRHQVTFFSYGAMSRNPAVTLFYELVYTQLSLLSYQRNPRQEKNEKKEDTNSKS